MLTVKEVIEHLKTLPQDAVCITTNSNTLEQSGDEPLRLPTYSSKGSVKTIHTYDAFDGEPYSYEMWSAFGGDKKVVKF
jgi:hypothetical protein